MDKSSHFRIYEFEKFRLDTGHLMLYHENEEVPLPPKAVETLLVLVENRGRILSKDELMKIIWTDSIVEESNLAKYLHLLRKTLGGRQTGDPFIETFRRRGYRFNGEVKIGEMPVEPGLGKVPNRFGARTVTDIKMGREQPSDEFLSIAPPRKFAGEKLRKYLFAGAIVLGMLSLMSFFFALTRLRSEKPESAAPVKSIAVLPFQNDAGTADIEYLSDGITESIINNLSQFPGLRVISRNSSFRFRQNQSESQNIASQLGVESIVTGDIKQVGDKFVINVRLIKGGDDSQIWGNRFVKNSADIFAIQDEIAQTVATNLHLKLTSSASRQPNKYYPKNVEAYHLYLKARHQMLKLKPPEMRKSIEFSRQAIDADPTYALAYVGLADAYRLLSITGEMPPGNNFPKAKAALAKALEIDEALADAHSSLGSVKFWFDWDWQGAEAEFRRAIELAPNNPLARPSFAHFLSNMGRHDEAVAEIRRAREQDPLSLTANSLEGLFLFHAARDDEAVVRLQKTFEIEPSFWLAHINLAKIYIRQGRFDEALGELNIVKGNSVENTEAISLTGYTLAIAGKRSQAENALGELKSISAQRYVSFYHFALICNGLDRQDETFEWLEKAFRERDVYLSFIKVDPKWDKFRTDPRFATLLKRMNLE